MFKNVLTILFYDPDRGWVKDIIEKETVRVKQNTDAQPRDSIKRRFT